MKSFDFINEAASNFSQTPIGYAKTTMNVQGSAPVISTTSNVASAPAQPINLKHVKKSLDNLSRSEKSKILKLIKTELNKKKIRKEGQIYFQGGGGPEAQHYYEPRTVPNQNELEKQSSSILEGIEREEIVSENLRKWFKEKWVRFGPDGKIRGACARGDDSEGKPKCLPQAKAHSLGKKGRKYAAAKKRREDPNPERRGPAKNVATKKKSNEGQLNELSPELLKRASAAAQTKYDQAADYGNKLSDTEAQALMKHYSQQQSKFAQGAKLAQNRSDRASSLAKIGMSDVAKRKTGVVEGSNQYLVYISKNKVREFEEWMESEGLETEVPKKDVGEFIVYDYSGQDVITKSYADDWNEKGQGVAEAELDEACWKGYHKEGMKTMFGKQYPNCVKNKKKKKANEDQAPMFTPEMKCPHCNGEMVSEELMNEKKDACYYKVKSRYKVWPSAYASGALVKCRKKGAKNWGTGGKKNESIEENLGMPYPGTYEQETLPYRTKGQKRTQSIAFETKQIEEKWSQKYKKSINCSNPKGFSQRAHCAGRKKK